jgi:hypothetical protein
MTDHRIDQLDAIVFCWVVTGGNHDANSCIALLGAESCDEADGVDDMVKKGTVRRCSSVLDASPVRRGQVDRGQGQLCGMVRATYAFMRN